MIGTILNVAGILIGGLIGLSGKKQLSPQTELTIKNVMAGLTVLIGLKTIWAGISGTFSHVLAQIGIAFLSLILGRLIGILLHLQKLSNKLGQAAVRRIQKDPKNHKAGEGFITCTILFCVGPMAILGSLQDGLRGDYQTLALKACLDGLATLVFASVFGAGVLLSAIPVLAYQGTITLLAKGLAPILESHDLASAISITGGLLICTISLIILNIRKVDLTNYLPSLAIAPLLTWWWR